MPRKKSEGKAQMPDEELRQYETMTEMTAEERKALHEWVEAGHSVYESLGMTYTEQGDPADFLEDYRYWEGISSEMSSMTPRQRKDFIARFRGEDTINELREELEAMRQRIQIYESFLRQIGRLAEANGHQFLLYELGDEIEEENLPF